MDATQANLDTLRVDFSNSFQSGYDSVEPYAAGLYSTIPGNAASTRFGWLAQSVSLNEWIGPRIVQNLSEHDYSIDSRDWEGTMEVDRNQIEDDTLGIFSGMHMVQLGAAVKQAPDQLFEELIRTSSGAGPLAFDGKALFANDHPTYGPATDPISGATVATTYDNHDALAFNATNLKTVWNKMVNIKGENGRPLRVRPTHLLHAPQLKFEVNTVLASASYAQMVAGDPGTGASAQAYGVATVENPMRGLVTPYECPGLADNGTFWALADLSKPIKPFVLVMRRAFQFVARDNPADPEAFNRKKFLYGVDGRMAFGVTLPFLIFRGNAI